MDWTSAAELIQYFLYWTMCFTAIASIGICWRVCVPGKPFKGLGSREDVPSENGNFMTIRILLVDDHPIVRQGLKTLLEGRSGWEVIGEASDGAEAVEKAKDLKPDVMVLDVTMPRMNGLEACRVLRTQAPQLEILFVTQHDSPQMLREALEAGARGYVVKSNAARDLLRAVEAVSQHRVFTALNGVEAAGLS